MGDGYVCPPEFDQMQAMRKLYVARIDRSTSDTEMREYFSSFGEVEDSLVMKKDTGKPYTFGFITFKSCDDLDECLLQKDDLELKGSHLDVKRAVPKDNTSETAHVRTKQLFLSNVTPGLTAEDVQEYLEKRHPKRYGVIEKVQLMKAKDPATGQMTDRNRGFGFITVSSEDFADRIAIGDSKFNIGGMKNPQGIEKAKPQDGEGGGGARGGRGGGQRSVDSRRPPMDNRRGPGGGGGGDRRGPGGYRDDRYNDSYSSGYDSYNKGYGGGYGDSGGRYDDSYGRGSGGGGRGGGYDGGRGGYDVGRDSYDTGRGGYDDYNRGSGGGGYDSSYSSSRDRYDDHYGGGGGSGRGGYQEPYGQDRGSGGGGGGGYGDGYGSGRGGYDSRGDDYGGPQDRGGSSYGGSYGSASQGGRGGGPSRSYDAGQRYAPY